MQYGVLFSITCRYLIGIIPRRISATVSDYTALQTFGYVGIDKLRVYVSDIYASGLIIGYLASVIMKNETSAPTEIFAEKYAVRYVMIFTAPKD